MANTAAVAPAVDRHRYLLKTPVEIHRRVKRVAGQYGISYNGAVCMLLVEALDARNIPQDT